MNIKVVCRKDARNSQGKVPLIIRFTHRRQTKTLSTGIVVDPSVWDEKSQRLTDYSPQYREMQLRLDSLLNEYHKKIRRLEALDIDVNFETLFEPAEERIDCTVDSYFRRVIEQAGIHRQIWDCLEISSYMFLMASVPSSENAI